MTGTNGERARQRTASPDRSKYPKHVPTIREQLEDSRADVDPDNLTVAEVEHMTAVGVLANPMTLRTRYEEFYEAKSTKDRMERWATAAEESHNGHPATIAHIKYGEDHEQTVYPSKSRV